MVPKTGIENGLYKGKAIQDQIGGINRKLPNIVVNRDDPCLVSTDY